MMKNEQTNFVSRKETLADVLESLLATKGSGFGTVIKVFLGLATIGWLADSILPFLHALSMFLWTNNIPEELNLKITFYKFMLPFIWSVLYITLLFAFRSSKIKTLQYKTQGSFPHRCLIVSLSPLNEDQIRLADLEGQLDNKTLNIEEFYNNRTYARRYF